MSLQPLELRALWSLIPTPQATLFNSYPLDAPLDGVRLAIDNIGRRHLLIELVDGQEIRSSQGIVSEIVRSLAFDGIVSSFLDVELSEPALSDEFDALICDVLEDGNDAEGRARGVHAALSRWRSMMRLAASRVMSTERRLGLFGELTMLQRLSETADEPWRSWHGPLAAPHDFEFDHACVEVKTMGIGAPGIRIHGLEQLQADADELYLLICVTSEDPGGSTLAEIADDLKRQFASSEFNALLARAGWSELLEPGPRLLIEQIVVIRVIDGVPRLLGSDVPTGVFAVDYDLELETLKSHATQQDLGELLVALTRGASE